MTPGELLERYKREQICAGAKIAGAVEAQCGGRILRWSSNPDEQAAFLEGYQVMQAAMAQEKSE